MSRQVLAEILSYRRPARSRSEAHFRKRFILPLPGAYVDAFRNIHVRVGEEDPRILWSCHTDSVHGSGGKQRVRAIGDIWSLADPASRGADCLGADDAIGVYLCRSMILAGVPGHYVFHHAEESGGIGSGSLADAYGAWLATFTHAIAFDRRGTEDIITHQAGQRSASDAGAWQIAALLAEADPRLDYEPSSHGIYTDTAEYIPWIPECTNVSVGYEREHTPYESVNVAHVERLRDALCTIDWSRLSTSRTPGDDDRDRDWRRWIYEDAEEDRQAERDRWSLFWDRFDRM